MPPGRVVGAEFDDVPHSRSDRRCKTGGFAEADRRMILRPEIQHCEMTRRLDRGPVPSHQVKNSECVRRLFYPRCDLKRLAYKVDGRGNCALPTA
jgi:hypothetical protein